MQPARHALVAGGTGLIGNELLALLGNDTRYHSVTSLVRRDAPTVAGVTNRIISFDDFNGCELRDVEDAYCCLGTTRRAAGSDDAVRKVDLEYVLTFARAAKRAGAIRFLLVSSLGADAASRFLYLRLKGEAEAGVSALGFSAVGIARPSFLVGRRTVARFGETFALLFGQAISPFMLGPLQRIRPVAAHTVASGLIHMAFTVPLGVTVISSKQIANMGGANNKDLRDY
jgi:uncharacterized protein YbjT (DUF2867 family)